jgi:hypothetical protein
METPMKEPNGKLGPKTLDLRGQRFGRLVVKNHAGTNASGHAMWLCYCSCGETVAVLGNNLKSHRTESCGCLHREMLAKRSTIHGHARPGNKSREYSVWRNMITRCTNPKFEHWENYGGATPPVKICKRWQKFENFLADLGTRPKGTTLSRIADSGDYKPSNAVWGTRAHQREQQRLKREGYV